MNLVVSIGFRGHFICADMCRWFMHHHVNNKFCVSSIGEYRPDAEITAIVKKYTPWSINEQGMHTIGYDGYYETMVFTIVEGEPCNEGMDECNCPHGGHGTSEEVLQRRYQTEQDAERDHQAIIDEILETGTVGYEPGIIKQLMDALIEDNQIVDPLLKAKRDSGTNRSTVSE